MKLGLTRASGEPRTRNGTTERVSRDSNATYIDKVAGPANCNTIGNRDLDMFDDDW